MAGIKSWITEFESVAAKVEEAVHLIREHNAEAVIVTTPWTDIDGKDILSAMEERDTLAKDLEELEHEHEHHHHHHHEHGEHCECGCHEHHHHDEEHEHHHHHDDDEHCECGCHEHHHHDEEHEHHHHRHDHGEHCSCGCHDHDHHHHHADEVFSSYGVETATKFTAEGITAILEALDEGDYGMILRAKGIVAAEDGKWIHFDYVPGEPDVRFGTPSVIGRLCVIGSGIDKEKIKELIEG